MMVTADGEAKEFPIAGLPVVIGRSGECKLRVPLDSVSRQHCELAENDDEELVIRDLNSSNGTFVNKERVEKRELIPGDLLSVGPVVFVVKIDGHPKDVDPKTAFANGSVAVGGGAPAMIDGVPTWSGQGEPSKPAPKKPADEDDSFESLLKSLREDDDDK